MPSTIKGDGTGICFRAFLNVDWCDTAGEGGETPVVRGGDKDAVARIGENVSEWDETTKYNKNIREGF